MTSIYDKQIKQYAYTQTFRPEVLAELKKAAHLTVDSTNNYSDCEIACGNELIEEAFAEFNETELFEDEAYYQVYPEWTQAGAIHFHGIIASKKTIHLASPLCNKLRAIGRMTLTKITCKPSFDDWIVYSTKVSNTSVSNY